MKNRISKIRSMNNIKNIILGISIFSILTIIPLIFFYFQISTFSETEKQKRFIAQKLKMQLRINESPQVEEIVFPEEYEALPFGKDLEVGDYIFNYNNIRRGVFVDRETEEIIGFARFGP